MKWWQIPQNCNCIFALDAESSVQSDKVFFTNNINRFLTYQTGTSKTSLTLTSGTELKNHSPTTPLRYKTYKTLSINGSNLIFDTPIRLTNEFTIILKCRVRAHSLFLSQKGINYGLTFGTDTASNAKLWRIDGFLAGSEIPASTKEQSYDDIIQTVILKGNISSKSVTFKTDYGTYTIPMESDSFQRFLKEQTFDTLGYSPTDTTWPPDADIICYGLFDKILSEETITQILKNVDETFLLKSSPISLNERKLYETFNLNLKTLEGYKPLDVYKSLSFKNPREASITTLREDTIIVSLSFENLLYTDTFTLSDIVLEEGIPTQTKLFLLEKNTNTLLKSTISDSSGVFHFYNLSPAFDYIITANDPKYQFQSIIKNYNK